MHEMQTPGDLALFLSSIAAATTVENIGNSKFINKDQFEKNRIFTKVTIFIKL